MEQLQIGARKPLFFMHIPKTAGMSMLQATHDAVAWVSLIGIDLSLQALFLPRMERLRRSGEERAHFLEALKCLPFFNQTALALSGICGGLVQLVAVGSHDPQ